MKSGPPWRASSLAQVQPCWRCTDGHSQCASGGAHHNFTHNDAAISAWVANVKISPMQMVNCKIGCVHKSLQIHCVHFAIIQKSLLLLNQVPHFWEMLIGSGCSTNPIYFQVCVGFQIETQTPTQTQMPKWRWYREPRRLLRASENLAGTANGEPGVFLEAERPKKDLIRLDLMIIIIDRFNYCNNW